MELFSSLLKLPRICVFALENKEEKSIYIGYSSNLLSSLSNLTKSINLKSSNMYDHKDKLNLIILEEFDYKHSKLELKIRYQYWVDYYSNAGYNLYRNYRAIKLSVNYSISRHYSNNHKLLFYVYLCSSRSNRFIVGVFDNKQDMDEFIGAHYSSNIFRLVYASNDLTKEFHEIQT